MPFPPEVYDISDEERFYWVKNNDELRAQRIASLKSMWTFVRENRDIIDVSIRKALGGQPIIQDMHVDSIE